MATWEECVEDLRAVDPVAAKHVELVAEAAGTTDGDWEIFKAAGLMGAQYERLSQGIAQQLEQGLVKLMDLSTRT